MKTIILETGEQPDNQASFVNDECCDTMWDEVLAEEAADTSTVCGKLISDIEHCLRVDNRSF